MAAAGRYEALRRAELTLEYIHANSTTHDFLFGAIAELIDNARDAGATRFDIFTVDNDKLQGGFMLCFLDEGCGMTPKEATDLIYFGRSSKRASISRMIGRYGNGLKSGSMRIGKDFILFTKRDDMMTCVLFSQTFCETEGLNEVIVPITSWSRNTRQLIITDLEKFTVQMSIIFKYSPFKSETELLQQFDTIYGISGSLIIIYNLKLMLNGEPELDVRTDSTDILIAGLLDNLPERRSLRAYTAVLYFDPRMRIFIQAEKVETKRLPYCFYRPRMYPYMTSSFKSIAMNEIKKAKVDVKIAEQAVEEAKCQLKDLEESRLHEVNEKSAQLALLDAVENAKRMREKLEEKQRQLRKPKQLYLMFGINIENRGQDGMLIYNNSRLIRMYEKVGPHRKQFFLGGAVGMVDVPLEVMEPTHNKQAFVDVKEYKHLLTSMEQYLVQYWKDVGISQKGVTSFWNEFGYLGDKWLEKPSNAIQYKRRRAVEVPSLVQCDICLKWRVLSSMEIENRDYHAIWTCAKIPGPEENKCDRPEHLPSIPLGTLNRPSQSSNDREKLLVGSIQRHQRKLSLQSQKSCLIKPHSIAQYGDSSRTLLINANENVQKTVSQRNAFQRGPAPPSLCLDKFSRKEHVPKKGHKRWDISEYRATSQKKARPHEQQTPPISRSEKVKDHRVSLVSPCERESQQLFLEKSDVARIKKEDSEPEIICITESEDESEDLSKCGESKEFFQLSKGSFGGKQKQCDLQRYICVDLTDATKIKGNHLPPPKLERVLAEDPKESAEGKVQVAMQEPGVIAHTGKSSQCMSEKKTIETLTSHLREVLLYFLPDCRLSREQLICMSAEDLVSMFKPEDPSEELKQPALCCSQVMKDYFVQYESKILRKIQSLTHQTCEEAYVSELQQRHCELQIKATQEKLKSLQEKMTKLIRRIHPELLAELRKHCQSLKENRDVSLEGDRKDDLQQIDGYLEELLKKDVCQTGIAKLPVINTKTAKLGESVVPCKEIADIFKN